MKAWFMAQIEGSSSIQSLLSAFRRLPNDKQRLVLLLLAGVIVLFIARVLVMPIYKDYQASVSQLAAAKSDYALLAKNANELSSSQSSEPVFLDRTSTQLRSLVNETLKETNLSPDVISREGKSLLRVGISDASFQAIADWLNVLAEKQVKINSLQLQALSPGMVSLSVSLD